MLIKNLILKNKWIFASKKDGMLIKIQMAECLLLKKNGVGAYDKKYSETVKKGPAP